MVLQSNRTEDVPRICPRFPVGVLGPIFYRHMVPLQPMVSLEPPSSTWSLGICKALAYPC